MLKWNYLQDKPDKNSNECTYNKKHESEDSYFSTDTALGVYQICCVYSAQFFFNIDLIYKNRIKQIIN